MRWCALANLSPALSSIWCLFPELYCSISLIRWFGFSLPLTNPLPGSYYTITQSPCYEVMCSCQSVQHSLPYDASFLSCTILLALLADSVSHSLWQILRQERFCLPSLTGSYYVITQSPCYEVMNSLLHIILSFLLQAQLLVAQSAQLAAEVNDIVSITQWLSYITSSFLLNWSLSFPPFFPSSSLNLIGNNIGYIHESLLNLPWKMLHFAHKVITLCSESCYTVPWKLLHCALKAVTLCTGICCTAFRKLLNCSPKAVTLFLEALYCTLEAVTLYHGSCNIVIPSLCFLVLHSLRSPHPGHSRQLKSCHIVP